MLLFFLMFLMTVLLYAVFGYWGSILGSKRTVGDWGGFFLGLFLGPLGLLIILLFPRRDAARAG